MPAGEEIDVLLIKVKLLNMTAEFAGQSGALIAKVLSSKITFSRVIFEPVRYKADFCPGFGVLCFAKVEFLIVEVDETEASP